MNGLFARSGALRRAGVLGINRRNAEFILPNNPRAKYPCVDDKLLTKQLAAAAAVPIPRLLGTVAYHHELRRLPETLRGLDEFVLKPARGAQGNGIVVIVGSDQTGYRKSTGMLLSHTDLRQHISSTMSGVFSLRGDADTCVIEARVTTHPVFEAVARFGIPDIRVIVYRGVPVMAMCRLPTVGSDGRANVHQGAIAAGLDIAGGRVLHAAHHNCAVTHHVDTHEPIIGLRIPDWDQVLALAARASEICGFGYLGVDVVLDKERGPLLLELNARPGLAIQIANREGLFPRLQRIDSLNRPADLPWPERCALASELFGRSGS